MSAQLRAGSSLRDISPRKGVSLGGYPHHPRPNTGVHDPLYAACLYLSDGQTQLALVTLDIIGLSKSNVQKIREKASKASGIPGNHIMISCSHSHSAPRGSSNMTMDVFETQAAPDEVFVGKVIDSAAAIITEAAASAVPAELGIEKGFCGREQGVGGNRRDPLGPADPEVWTIGVKDRKGNLLAVMVKYALHPTFLHSDNFLASADYPGYIRSYINSRFPETVFLFAQGTSGNQSPRYFRSGKTFAEAERVGTAIGREAERVLQHMSFSGDIPLVVKSREIMLDLRTFPKKEEAEARVEEARKVWHTLRDSGAPEPDVWNAELLFLGAEDTLSMLLLHEKGELTALNENSPMEVQVLGIGDVRIACLPGEIFVEYGITIQYRSPFPKTFVIELANGALPGYAATEQAYASGGYETGASMLTGKSGLQLVDTAVKLLFETRREQVPRS